MEIIDSSMDSALAIHQYYMDIINCMPNIVYWIDVNCVLKGCNNHFIKMLGTKKFEHGTATPYQQLVKHAGWDSDRVESFMLDDMAVIFSGEVRSNVIEVPIVVKNQQVLYFTSTRVPLFDQQKQVVGLVVILTDNSKSQAISDRSSPYNLNYPFQPFKDKTIRALIVEDNPIAQKVEQALLTELNCKVDLAASGEQALQLFVPGQYDLVLMDIGLQDTSGYIVAKKIREMEKNTKDYVPIVALTSYQADVVKYDCRDYLMDGVMTKPLSKKQAEQIIQYYVHRENIKIDGLYLES